MASACWSLIQVSVFVVVRQFCRFSGVPFYIHLSLQIHQWKSLSNRSIILIIYIKGKPTTPVINNKESEIHGCKVNVTWSRKGICTITKSSVRFREREPLAIEAEWKEYKVPSTTFHLLSLECDKGYEIGVSSWFGEVQSNWSVSWKLKTQSAGATLPYVCPIADKDLVLTLNHNHSNLREHP